MTSRPVLADYAPYHKSSEFNRGIADYAAGRFTNPYVGVAAQAWDRGLEYAMRVARFTATER
jgi:hypothetical protein